MNTRRLEGLVWRLEPEGSDENGSKSRENGASARPVAIAAALFPERPQATARVAPGDVLVHDGRFGGHLRDVESIRALSDLGLAAIVAREFDPEFYRLAAEAGVLLLINPDAASALAEGSRVRVDIETGLLHDLSTGEWHRSSEPLEPLRSAIERIGVPDLAP